VKPLDSNGGAVEHSSIEDPALAARTALGGAERDEFDEDSPRARSEVVAAPRHGPFAPPSALQRVSQVVPVGTAGETENEGFGAGGFDDADANAAGGGVDPADAGASGLAASEGPDAVAEQHDLPEEDGSELTPSQPGLESVAANGAAASDIGPGYSSVDPLDEPRYPRALAARAARKPEFGATLHGPGFGLDDDDEEETTVDAGAALSDEEQDDLMRRIHSAMSETQAAGTPPPQPAQARAPQEARSIFRQTMLLGLPQLEGMSGRVSPAGASASVAATGAAASPPPTEPPAAVMASVVRVVGPPTQPPPRRSRRIGAVSLPEASEPDHEAFALSQPIAGSDLPRRASRAPISDVPTPRISRDSISRSSLPGVILPPPPQPQDYEAAPASMPPPLTTRPSLPLRATIDAPSSLSRTQPPTTRAIIRAAVASQEAEDGLPTADPFAGFVAPPPSLAQRWLIVMVVALAVVGLCSLAAIAFGYLGKTGW
jgi:hypothetical protein